MPHAAFISYRSRVQRGLYTILGKTSYTLIRLEKHTFTILDTILGKTSYRPLSEHLVILGKTSYRPLSEHLVSMVLAYWRSSAELEDLFSTFTT